MFVELRVEPFTFKRPESKPISEEDRERLLKILVGVKDCCYSTNYCARSEGCETKMRPCDHSGPGVLHCSEFKSVFEEGYDEAD
ncbi:MAG: hypothetical protein ACYTEQ_01605 [Planctomycetota bacterium]|jgi:hypothetical protein